MGAGTLLAVWLVMSISGAEGIELAGGEAGPRGETCAAGCLQSAECLTNAWGMFCR